MTGNEFISVHADSFPFDEPSSSSPGVSGTIVKNRDNDSSDSAFEISTDTSSAKRDIVATNRSSSLLSCGSFSSYDDIHEECLERTEARTCIRSILRGSKGMATSMHHLTQNVKNPRNKVIRFSSFVEEKVFDDESLYVCRSFVEEISEFEGSCHESKEEEDRTNFFKTVTGACDILGSFSCAKDGAAEYYSEAIAGGAVMIVQILDNEEGCEAE